VREGLSYEGEEKLSYRDVLLGVRPEKVLFYAYSDLDRHGSLRAIDDELFVSFFVIANLSTVTLSIPVPFGGVVPKGIRGLVSAGRCISTDSYMQSAVRMNRDMFRMGECVGTGAAMAALSGVDFMDIDYGEYLTRVRAKGCFEGYSDRSFSFDNSYRMYLNKMAALGREPDAKYSGLKLNSPICEPIDFDVDKSLYLLKTDAPGVAIWSCYLAKNRDLLRDRLFSIMQSAESEMHRYNCAIALGLIGDKRALGVLTEIVEARDCFFFTDNRRTNQFRSAIAICLIGRVGGVGELPLLFGILDPSEIERPMYHTLEPNYLYHTGADRNFVYYSVITHTVMALYNIYKREQLDFSELHAYFSKLFEGDGLLRRVTDRAAGEAAYEEMEELRRFVLENTKPE